MSSGGNRFEKTFSRKKKEKGKDTKKPADEKEPKKDAGDEEGHRPLILALAAAQSPLANPSAMKTPKKKKKKSTSNGVAKSADPSKKPAQSPKPKAAAEPPKSKQKPQAQAKKNKSNGGGGGDDDSKVREEGQKSKRKAENGDEVRREKKQKKKKDDKGEGGGKERQESSDCTFPTTRIVRIIKSEGSDYRLSSEATFLINKATEKFIELFSEDAHECAVRDHKSFIGYKHLSAAVSNQKKLDFLTDFVPEKVPAQKALAEIKPAETLPS